MSAFLHHVTQKILKGMHDYHIVDNWDYLRFGPNPAAQVPGQIIFNLKSSTDYFIDFVNNHASYGWFHDMLEDDYSRALLVDLLAYRVLGCGHCKLPLNTKSFWQEYRTIDSRFMRQGNVAKSWFFDLNLYAVPIHNHELQLVGHALSMLILLIGQYYYDRNGVRIQPEPGDVVLDGGGCWGEAAIAFASTVGPAGKVYSFEFVPENLVIFRENLARCASLSKIVTIVENALGNQSHLRVPYQSFGPASSLGGKETDRAVATVSIDDFVAANNIGQLDFLKMDIEGSEQLALQGAKSTLKRFKPKLAISLYHWPHDFYQIPQLIRQIEPGYRFYLDHYTIHLEETVLYAQVR